MNGTYCDISSIVRRLDEFYLESLGMYEASTFAYNGLHTIMTRFLNEIPRYNKCCKILKNNNCFNCKYSIIEDNIIPFNEHLGSIKIHSSDKTKLCESCQVRIYKIEDLKDKIETSAYSLITDDIVKLRVILNKLKTKLKNYDASKHKINVCNTLHLHG